MHVSVSLIKQKYFVSKNAQEVLHLQANSKGLINVKCIFKCISKIFSNDKSNTDFASLLSQSKKEETSAILSYEQQLKQYLKENKLEKQRSYLYMLQKCFFFNGEGIWFILCDTNGLTHERYWEVISIHYQENQYILKNSEIPVNQSNQHRLECYLSRRLLWKKFLP